MKKIFVFSFALMMIFVNVGFAASQVPEEGSIAAEIIIETGSIADFESEESNNFNFDAEVGSIAGIQKDEDKFIYLGRGCCSHHRGVCSCDGGRARCCDGSYSPTCGC